MSETMEEAPDIISSPPEAAGRSGRAAWSALLVSLGRWRRDPQAQRGRRVIIALAFIWVVGLVDLYLTFLAQDIGGFVEANPIARAFIERPAAVIAYKFALMCSASAILIFYRRRRITEIGCWILAAAYAALTFAWAAYYRPF